VLRGGVDGTGGTVFKTIYRLYRIVFLRLWITLFAGGNGIER